MPLDRSAKPLPYCIGLTGGIASGKSAVADAFADLGIVIADADVAAREAVAVGSEGLAEAIAAFGPDILDAQGGLDRAKMRQRIFDDAAARARLEAIVHPRVRMSLQHRCETATSAYAIVAIPLLAEVGSRAAYPWLDRILIVDVSPSAQRARLMRRDGIDAALADRMIAAQADRSKRLAIADDVLVNDSDLATLRQHVETFDRQYRRLALAR
ncbi:MAG: dephospho-CoA kinase [Xanthomonadaceae bacterium]|nr:dephospho-CoA kinase [Xanthomonadaceae bacterium]